MSSSGDFALVRQDPDLCEHQIFEKLRSNVTRYRSKLQVDVVEKDIDKQQDYVTVRPTCKKNGANRFQQGAKCIHGREETS